MRVQPKTESEVQEAGLLDKGEYDFVVIVDYPNEVAALKAAGYAAALGVVQVQTLPACQIEDFVKVMSELPK